MSGIVTKTQTSAGGVVFRRRGGRVEVALISVGAGNRWQLPKGLVDAGESPEAAAVREAREETGLDAELVAPVEQDRVLVFLQRAQRARALPQVRTLLPAALHLRRRVRTRSRG
ncbi:MAG: NUDIX domain-containing protein [Pyrinomonadaceae bacterium]